MQKAVHKEVHRVQGSNIQAISAGIATQQVSNHTRDRAGRHKWGKAIRGNFRIVEILSIRFIIDALCARPRVTVREASYIAGEI